MNESQQNSVNRYSKGFYYKPLFLNALACKIIASLFLFMMTSAALAQNTLQDINVASLPNDEIQLSLEFSGTPTEPLAFTIDNPARIALDFAGTNNALPNRLQNICIGSPQSVNTAEAKGLAERRVEADRAYWRLIFSVAGKKREEISELASI